MAPGIRVLLIDDSAVVRGAMRQIIDAESDMRVVGTAANGRQGLDAMAQAAPDVVLLDIEMPELDGLATLPLLLAAHPGVRVIMASSLTQRGAQVTMDALAIGAADYVTKPTARAGPSALAPMAQEIVTKIRGLGARRGRVARPVATPAAAPVAAEPASRVFGTSRAAAPDLIAIASSTGGPNALVTVLRGIPAELRTPILITQHMPPLFTMLLAQRLQREAGRPCVEAKDGMRVEDGTVYLAPGDFHMVLDARDGTPTLRLSQSAPIHHCRPSADPMFTSLAEHYGPRLLAVVLTGMGEDGRDGCTLVRKRGGRVLVQDEATSVVWGMPGAVVAAGAATWVAPLEEIAPRITQLGMVAR